MDGWGVCSGMCFWLGLGRGILLLLPLPRLLHPTVATSVVTPLLGCQLATPHHWLALRPSRGMHLVGGGFRALVIASYPATANPPRTAP